MKFQLWFVVFLIPLEVQGHTIPHLKALRYGIYETRGFSCGSTSSICQGILKSGNLLHKWCVVKTKSLRIVVRRGEGDKPKYLVSFMQWSHGNFWSIICLSRKSANLHSFLQPCVVYKAIAYGYIYDDTLIIVCLPSLIHPWEWTE